MAPPSRHPSPLEQLRVLAQRARRRGLTFEEFWEEARRPGAARLVYAADVHPPPGAIRWPTDAKDRITWITAIDGTREGWRRAFVGDAPLASEAAVVRIGPFLEEPEPTEDDDLGGIEELMAVA